MAAITDMVNLEFQDGIAVVRIDNPPVNALSRGVRDGLYEAVKQADADEAAKAILIICNGGTYIAGADIKEFGKPQQGMSLFEVQKVIEGASKPVISTMHGTALGGGLETAITCHYRVAVASTKFGLPEVHLGILPGAGGTQRLPRIVGVEKALNMMVTGIPVNAKFALENGLIDEIVEDLFEGGMAFAKKIVEEGRPLVKVRDANEKLEAAKNDPELFDRFRKQIAHKARGFDSPKAIIQCVEDTLTKTFDEGIQAERERFMTLVTSIKSQAQRYYFFAERQAAKIPDVPKDTEIIPINKVGMIGAGTMGGGISMNFLSKGTPVTIVESNQEALDRGLAVVRKNYMRGVKSGRITEEGVDKLMALLTPSLSLEDLADCDMVIEAVFENLDLKKDVFRKLDGIVKEGAILATNSSALDVNAIAAVTKRPEWVIGTHFFSPANIMRLLEIVRAEKTSKPVLATAMGLAKRLGKIPVVSGVCPGFIGNRILFQRGIQAQKLIDEGAMPWEVDEVIYDFGFPMGPFAMGDLAGLDIGWDAESSKPEEKLKDKLCEMNRRGQKTGAGYYDYDPETRAKTPNAEVEKLILEFSERRGTTRREISKEEILQRCIYPMINEGAKILEEGISQRPSDIDVVWVNGYGWPVYRGGPMFYADTVGLDKVLEKLKEFQEQDQDDFWQPSPLIEKLVAEGKGFKDMA
ncbi:MAG: 3-hydroxyacyl-CoA dehydrogenase NAD-binding domain-containing protein [Verrucomicrobia bacterium]|nr:3-hydroxyacyl-CoA dehydrogenase NAD-binding domain-containing protein [Verrucomicrobiota bacterium]